MTLADITKFIDNKIAESQSKIVIKFFEMKIKNNLTDNELLSVLDLISIKLDNLGYKIYKTYENYYYRGKEYTVTINQLLVAIKE